MLCYVMLCYVMLCYVMLCYVMLCFLFYFIRTWKECYVMLCYVMLFYVLSCDLKEKKVFKQSSKYTFITTEEYKTLKAFL